MLSQMARPLHATVNRRTHGQQALSNQKLLWRDQAPCHVQRQGAVAALPLLFTRLAAINFH